MNNCDVLIVGGGMVGASLVAALSSLSCDVTVIEGTSHRDPGQPSFDDRATAVSWGSRQIFEALGLWDELASAATPIHRIHVSHRGRFGVTRICSKEMKVPALGYVVENRSLGAVLWQAMKATGAEIRCPARVGNISIEPGYASVSVRDATGSETEYRTRLLVAADGLRSSTREMLGVTTVAHPYEQVAVIANVLTEEFHEHVAYERFTPSGPLAFLPLSNRRCSVVWTLSPARATEVINMNDEAFLQALQTEFGYRLGKLQKAGSRQSYPLSLVQAQTVAGTRHALIGNAANNLHPVAGQGFNLGLRDVAALADVVADGNDPGSPVALRQYTQWRRDDHRRIAGMTDGLVRIFASELAPVRLLRGAGLQALDMLESPRSMLARQTMGFGGRLPRLARGVPLR